ncbi:MAG: hypothetical protein ABI554_13080 [Flavobacterium sp.]
MNAQISTSTGGAVNLQANTPISNTNVGIGTTNPTSKLEVNGDAKVSSLALSGSLANGQTFSSISDRNIKSLIFNAGNIVNPASPEYRMIKIFDFPQSNLDSKPLLWFGIEDRNNFGRFRILAETGGYTQLIVLNKNQEELSKIYEDGSDNVYMHFPKPNSRVVIGNIGTYLPQHKFVVSGSAKIEGNILTDANMGIGTSNFTDGTDTYRLSVKGKIRAEEIKVYNTWADYVFNPAYKLASLKEVESYITKNGHLQNVPSAKDITDKGLELGEMTKIQQEKIEELTLYLIQQNKEIEELKAQVKILMSVKN